MELEANNRLAHYFYVESLDVVRRIADAIRVESKYEGKKIDLERLILLTFWRLTEAKQYTEFDVNLANKHLDMAGITKRDAENYRLMSDGRRVFDCREVKLLPSVGVAEERAFDHVGPCGVGGWRTRFLRPTYQGRP